MICFSGLAFSTSSHRLASTFYVVFFVFPHLRISTFAVRWLRNYQRLVDDAKSQGARVLCGGQKAKLEAVTGWCRWSLVGEE